MKVRPLHPYAALLLESSEGTRYIAVTDLHIGLETELGSKGVTIKQDLLEGMVQHLLTLMEASKAHGLVLLGDIKHKIGTISKQEWDDVPAALKRLSAKSQVYLVPGNHDGNIRHLVPDSVNVISSTGMILEDTLLIHGHSMPSNVRSHVRRIVMGHLHPVFLKRGSLVSGERVWIYLKVKKEVLFTEQGTLEVVIVPSLNPYLYTMAARSYHKSISPIITRIMAHSDAVQKCVVATLDGSVIGDADTLPNIL